MSGNFRFLWLTLAALPPGYCRFRPVSRLGLRCDLLSVPYEALFDATVDLRSGIEIMPGRSQSARRIWLACLRGCCYVMG